MKPFFTGSLKPAFLLNGEMGTVLLFLSPCAFVKRGDGNKTETKTETKGPSRLRDTMIFIVYYYLYNRHSSQDTVFIIRRREMKPIQKNIPSRILGYLLILALIIVMIPAMPGEAATKKSKAIAAYKKMLSQSTVTVVPRTVRRRRGTKTYKPANAKNVCFTLACIDNDSIPELILVDLARDYYGIWTYRNGKVVNLKYVINFQEPGYYNKALGFYQKKGILTEYSAYPRGGYSRDYYRISNGKAIELFSICKDNKYSPVQYFIANSDGTYKNISRWAFNKKLKAYVGKTKFAQYYFFRNTASNRKKYLK